MKLNRWTLGLGLAAALILASGLWVATQPYAFHGAVIVPATRAPDFTLTTHTGNAFRLSEQRGKVVVLYFGYTFCPDVCPTTLMEFKKIRARLPRENDRVQFVFVTVDPERDTPTKLRDYLAVFDPAFVGLTGTMAELEPVWHAYGVYRAKVPGSSAMAYTMDHSARVYVIDANGDLRVTYSYGEDADNIAQDLTHLLGERYSVSPSSTSPIADGAVTLGDLKIENAWVRAVPAGMTSGVFLTITNHGAQPDVLIAAQSPVAHMVEVHQTKMENDVMKMSPVDRIAIPAGQTVELKPGGYHIMLMNINKTLTAGDRVPLTLKFERAGEIKLEAIVMAQ
jgi:protein SCO1/2